MMRRFYAELLSPTDVDLRTAQRVGRPVEVDGVLGKIVGRTTIRCMLDGDRERKTYAAYDILLDPGDGNGPGAAGVSDA